MLSLIINDFFRNWNFVTNLLLMVEEAGALEAIEFRLSQLCLLEVPIIVLSNILSRALFGKYLNGEFSSQKPVLLISINSEVKPKVCNRNA